VCGLADGEPTVDGGAAAQAKLESRNWCGANPAGRGPDPHVLHEGV